MRSRFDAARAERAVEFFERLLVHTKGAYARKPFELAPFQREIVEPLFGTVTTDPDTGEEVRLYQLAWLEMARKNGKSELMAGIALLLAGADDEEGAEVYGVAKDTDQASLVFNVAKRMVELSPLLSKHFTIHPSNRRIVYEKTSSFYRVVAADALGNLGQDPHGILFDEVIAQPNGELWDALKTGFGARRQPLMVAATTAGDDMADFALNEHRFSEQVAADPSLDPRRLVYIRNVPKDADWHDESQWGLANPALGLFLRPQVLRDELTSAMNNPREERRFRMFRLNQWQSGGLEGWVGAEAWTTQGNAGIVDEAKLKGKRCWGGIVANTATDITSVCWIFQAPEGAGVWALWRFFLPQQRLEDLNRRTSDRAGAWAKPGGPLTLTEGDQIDIDAILARIYADMDVFGVAEIASFQGNALGIETSIQRDRNLEPFRIGPNTPGSSILDWERFLRAGEFNHGGNPIASWQMAHVMARETPGGTARIDMKGSSENVTGIVAAELALRRTLLAMDEKPSEMVLTYRR